jgi:hypothetical protein
MAQPQEREDFLSEDADVPGQKFCLLSFLSPEKVLANKDRFFFETFLKTYELTFRIKSFESFLMSTVKSVNDKITAEADKAENSDLSGVAQVLRESRVRVDVIMDDLQKYFKDKQADLKASTLKEQYNDFLHATRDKLEEEFYAQNEFRTTVRGVKIRGSYSTKEEAVARSKKLQRLDPLHNIFVADVGKWLPWDPEPSQIAEQEYAEDQLNTLMKKYKENEEARELFERENRAKGALGAKKKTDVEREEAAAAADGLGNDLTEPKQEYHSMFSDSSRGDLAIERKLARANTET